MLAVRTRDAERARDLRRADLQTFQRYLYRRLGWSELSVRGVHNRKLCSIVGERLRREKNRDGRRVPYSDGGHLLNRPRRRLSCADLFNRLPPRHAAWSITGRCRHRAAAHSRLVVASGHVAIARRHRATGDPRCSGWGSYFQPSQSRAARVTRRGPQSSWRPNVQGVSTCSVDDLVTAMSAPGTIQEPGATGCDAEIDERT